MQEANAIKTSLIVTVPNPSKKRGAKGRDLALPLLVMSAAHLRGCQLRTEKSGSGLFALSVHTSVHLQS